MTEPRQPGYAEVATDSQGRDGLRALDRKTDREILACFVAASPRDVMNIATTAECHPITVDQTCARLHGHGLIRPVGRGRYDLTDAGRRLLEAESDTDIER